MDKICLHLLCWTARLIPNLPNSKDFYFFHFGIKRQYCTLFTDVVGRRIRIELTELSGNSVLLIFGLSGSHWSGAVLYLVHRRSWRDARRTWCRSTLHSPASRRSAQRRRRYRAAAPPRRQGSLQRRREFVSIRLCKIANIHKLLARLQKIGRRGVIAKRTKKFGQSKKGWLPFSTHMERQRGSIFQRIFSKMTFALFRDLEPKTRKQEQILRT